MKVIFLWFKTGTFTVSTHNWFRTEVSARKNLPMITFLLSSSENSAAALWYWLSLSVHCSISPGTHLCSVPDSILAVRLCSFRATVDTDVSAARQASGLHMSLLTFHTVQSHMANTLSHYLLTWRYGSISPACASTKQSSVPESWGIMWDLNKCPKIRPNV